MGYTTSVILEHRRNKTNSPTAACASAIQTDTRRREIRTSGKILQGAINQIQKINHSSASEAAREAGKQKTRLSLSLSPHPACKCILSNFWSSRRSVIDLETRISDYIMMQMCFPAWLAAVQLPLQRMSSEYQWRGEGAHSSLGRGAMGRQKPFHAELTQFCLGLQPPFPASLHSPEQNSCSKFPSWGKTELGTLEEKEEEQEIHLGLFLA